MARLTDGRTAIECDHLPDVLVLTFSSPILSLDVLDQFSSILQNLTEKSAHGPLVLCSGHPSVFLAGAHLAEIATLDASSSAPYARRGREAIRRLENHPAPTVAAINGSCSGGGFDLILACDALIAGPDARFSHPGIRRGLVTGWSGTTRLPSALGGAMARTALLETRELEPDPLSHLGSVHRTVEGHREIAIEKARQLASLDPARYQLWRALRGFDFVDRFHASVVHKL